MFNSNKTEDPALEAAITDLYAQMETVEADSDEYNRVTDQLSKLYKIKNENERSRDKFSKDTLVLAGCNLIGIASILSYEHAHVIASKALSFVMKPR